MVLVACLGFLLCVVIVFVLWLVLSFWVLRVVGCGFCTILVIVGLVLCIVFLGVGSAMSVAGFGFCGVVW